MGPRWIIKNNNGWLTSYAPGAVSWGTWAKAKYLDRAELVEAILVLTSPSWALTAESFIVERAG